MYPGDPALGRNYVMNATVQPPDGSDPVADGRAHAPGGAQQDRTCLQKGTAPQARRCFRGAPRAQCS